MPWCPPRRPTTRLCCQHDPRSCRSQPSAAKSSPRSHTYGASLLRNIYFNMCQGPFGGRRASPHLPGSWSQADRGMPRKGALAFGSALPPWVGAPSLSPSCVPASSLMATAVKQLTGDRNPRHGLTEWTYHTAVSERCWGSQVKGYSHRGVEKVHRGEETTLPAGWGRNKIHRLRPCLGRGRCWAGSAGMTLRG